MLAIRSLTISQFACLPSCWMDSLRPPPLIGLDYAWAVQVIPIGIVPHQNKMASVAIVAIAGIKKFFKWTIKNIRWWHRQKRTSKGVSAFCCQELFLLSYKTLPHLKDFGILYDKRNSLKILLHSILIRLFCNPHVKYLTHTRTTNDRNRNGWNGSGTRIDLGSHP